MSKCLICNSDLTSEKNWARENKFIKKCSACRVCFDPTVFFFNSSQAKIIYEHMYHGISLKNYMQSLRNKLSSDLVKSIIADSKGKGRLLDIGCSYGEIVEIFKNNGWDASGIDISSEPIKFGQARGLDTKIALIEDFIPSEKFNVVVLSHVLEHLRDPVTVINTIVNKILAHNGRLYINVPNLTSSLANKFDFIFKGELKPNEHLFYFTKESLGDLLSKIKSITFEGREIEKYSLATIVNCYLRSYFLFLGNSPLDPLTRSVHGKSSSSRYFYILKTYESVLRLIGMVKIGKQDRELLFVIKKINN